MRSMFAKFWLFFAIAYMSVYLAVYVWLIIQIDELIFETWQMFFFGSGEHFGTNSSRGCDM